MVSTVPAPPITERSMNNAPNPQKTLGEIVIKELGDLGGLPAEITGTILIIGGALIKLIRSGGDTIARQEALYTVAEEAKAALDREKFPGQDY